MTEQPPPLNYRHSVPPPSARFPFLEFVGGVIVGLLAVGISAMASGATNEILPVVLAGGEFVAGVVLTVMSRRGRPFGIGLICAIPIGVMLFFVGCAIMISMK